MNPTGEIAKLGQRLLHLLECLGDGPRGGCAARLSLRPPERQRGQNEELLCAVVQIALETPPSLDLGFHHARGYRPVVTARPLRYHVEVTMLADGWVREGRDGHQRSSPSAIGVATRVSARGPTRVAARTPAGTAIMRPAIWTTAPTKPPTPPGSPSVDSKPLPAIVAITPPSETKAAATSPTAGAQRHGPKTTTAAATSRMIGPGGIVGKSSPGRTGS